MRRPRFVSIALLVLLLSARLASAQQERKISKLAEGVYAIQHKDEGGLTSGNTTVIVGDRQVFVVDTCFLPASAREDIAEIRNWTDKPVSFVLNTHFHNDHNFGNRIYMDAFPDVTIIAHVETKKDMDRFGPGSAGRVEKETEAGRQMLKSGKTPEGQSLTEDDKAELKKEIAQRVSALVELRKVTFQSATLAFDHDFSLDLGDREVQVKFLGKGNTAGDAVVYLPKEKIVIAGDLIVHPIPYFLDGYPAEWVDTLTNLSALDADTIVPGHGPIMHDKNYVLLVRDLIKSAEDQMNDELRKIGPALSTSADEVKGGVDLGRFRSRFAGNDRDLGQAFDLAAAQLVKLVFEEDSLR